MKKRIYLNLFLFIALIFSLNLLFSQRRDSLAQKLDPEPISENDLRLKTAYDWLVAKGANYGATASADWTEDWGTYWNRIMAAATWEPAGSATAGEVSNGLIFYSGNNDRTQKTGTLEAESSSEVQSSGSCDSAYTGKESTWTLTASDGTAQSVTDNAVTRTLSSNKVYQDGETKLYWSDRTSETVDNEFVSDPSGSSCNFNSSDKANAYCDKQSPSKTYSEDDDVSAAEFCLNLELDADNTDGDNNGATGLETNWRLPTRQELEQAYNNGAGNHLPNPNYSFWSSGEDGQNNAWRVFLCQGSANSFTKMGDGYVRCVRG